MTTENTLLWQRIDAGIKGFYKGLTSGLGRVDDYLYGIQRATIYLLGGESGTYKTTLCDYMVMNAIESANLQGIKLNVFYNSWEIDETSKKILWLSSRIYTKYKVYIPPQKIKSMGSNVLTPVEIDYIKSEIPYIESLFAKINWSWTPVNPTGLYNKLFKFGSENSTFEYEEYKDEDGEIKKKISKAIPNNPNDMTLVILDHMYYLRKERGYQVKEVMDKWSEYTVALRNLFGYSFINLQQFNDGMSAVDRQKFKGVDISPQKNDFKDS
jgi:hypothetical protein